MRRVVAGLVAAGALVHAVHAAPAAGQGVRGSLSHTGFYAELRPLAQDTVRLSQVTQISPTAWEYEGLPIYCQGTQCIRYRAGDVASTVSGSVDASLTAWGLGVQGLSTTVSLRARERTGGELLWPRTDDQLDVFLAYAQYTREGVRARLGRQRILGGLGRNAFDGGSVLWTPRSGWSVEGFAGRSLARGLAEPRNSALQGLESFLPDQNAWLFGGTLRGRPTPDVDVTVRYQREIWSDRSGLLSERASLDVRSYPFDLFRLDASADWDFAFGRVGKAHLTALLPLRGRSLMLEASARRYLPYFELWTVWGFFSPVPYNEGHLRLTWAPRPGASVWLAGAFRSYGETNSTTVLQPLEDTGRRGQVGFSWALDERFGVQGEYRVEWAAGAFFNGGDAALTAQLTPDLRVSLNGTAFQQIQEFRLGQGTALGGGLSFDASLPWQKLRLNGGLSVFRAGTRNRIEEPDWNQVRGHWNLSVPIGNDPGLEGSRR
jgi:hypothetical protein